MLGRGVDDVLRHHPVGRVLAARDRDEVLERPPDRVLAADLRRLGLVVGGDERAQPDEDALDVVVGQRALEDLVDVVEQIVDVLRWVAAVCAGSSFQGVSVVPIIQWFLPHGITNRTLFSVWRMSPVSDSKRSRGTRKWMPLEARDLGLGWLADQVAEHRSSTRRARRPRSACGLENASPVSRSCTRTARTRSPSRSSPVIRVLVASAAPYCAAVRATATVWRASSICPSWYWMPPIR